MGDACDLESECNDLRYILHHTRQKEVLMPVTDQEIRQKRMKVLRHGGKVALVWYGSYPEDMEEANAVHTRMMELQGEMLSHQGDPQRPEVFLCIRQRGATPVSPRLYDYVAVGFTTRSHADDFLQLEQ